MRRIKIIISLATQNPIGTIIIWAVIIRILTIFLYQNISIFPDSKDYIDLAKRIVEFNINGYDGRRSPGYPFVIAIFGGFIPILVLFQLIIGVLTSILLYKILVLCEIRQKVALLITVITTSYIPTIFFEFAILTESLTLLFIMIAFYLFFQILYKNSKRLKVDSYLLIITLIALVLIKPFYVCLPFFFILLFILKNRNKKAVTYSTMAIFLPLVVFLGWSYINKQNTGHFVSTTYYGFNLAQNCVRFAEHTTDQYQSIGNIYAKYRDTESPFEVSMTIWQALPELEKQTKLNLPDLSKLLYDYSIATIKLNPVQYAHQVFISWCDFWKTSMYWYPEKAAFPIVIKYLNLTERIVFQFFKLLFVMSIPLCLINSIRTKSISPQFIISSIICIVSILQAIATYGTNSRFSFPFETMMVVSVCIVFNNLWIIYKKKKVEG